VWVSEIGWSTKGPKDDELVTSRKGQAKRLTKTMKMLTAVRDPFGIRLASWFTYEDADFAAYCDWCPGGRRRGLRPAAPHARRVSDCTAPPESNILDVGKAGEHPEG